MKFITEEDLRDLYKKQPFTDYDLKEGERLTPGARQFLVDRGIDMYDRNDPMAVLDAQKKEKAKAAQAAKTESSSGCRNGKKLCSRMKALQSLFLLTARDLLDTDLCLSQQLTGLSRQFAALGSVSEGKCEADGTGVQCMYRDERGKLFPVTSATVLRSLSFTCRCQKAERCSCWTDCAANWNVSVSMHRN